MKLNLPALFALTVVGTSNAAALPTVAPRTTTVTFTVLRQSSIPVISVLLNDIAQVHFLVDTGSTFTVITDTEAAQLGLTPKPLFFNGKPVMWRGMPAVGVNISKIRVGSFVYSSDQVVVTTARDLADANQPLDGVLGNNLLRISPALFDFKTCEITFWSPTKLSSADLQAVGMTGVNAASLHLSPSGELLTVLGRLDNRVAAEFDLDTGAWQTGIASAVAAKLKLKPLGQQVSGTLDGPIHSELARTKSLNIGSVTVEGPIVAYSSSTDAKSQSVLGVDILKNFRVLVDAPDGKLFLDPAFSQVGPEDFQKWKVYDVPIVFRNSNQVPLASMILQDGKSHQFALGLGSPVNLIDRAIARQIGLTVHDSGSAGPGQPQQVMLSGQLGDLNLKDEPFVLDDIPGVGAAGILGYPLLSRGAMNLNFSQSKLTFTLPGSANIMPLPDEKWSSVPLANQEGSPAVKGLLDDRPFTAIPSFVFTLTQMGPEAPFNTFHPVNSLHLEILGDVQGAQVVRLHELTVGKVAWRDPVVTGPSGFSKLGLSFWRRYHVILDLVDNMLYLEPDPAYLPTSIESWKGTGIVSWRHDAEPGLVIDQILTPSPAKLSGIQLGDRVLEIEGMATSKMSNNEVAGYLWSPSRNGVRLKVHRVGIITPLEYDVPTRSLL